jgi:alanine-glyoxylate transaminase/serine-glyoxylate transaminase/serine-pyruvate transaminase
MGEIVGVERSMEKLLLIPGPSPVHPRIIRALSEPTVSHVSPELASDLTESLDNLKKIVFTAKGEPFVISGAGTLAMEIALLNILTRGERTLILSQGYFGDRMAQICQSFGLDFDLVQSRWGSVVLPEDLERKIDQGRYQAVFSTHVDTGTGACAPIQDYARVLKDRDILYVVDGVCATGGIEERLDDWGIDIVFTAAQKCFGAPPGLAILVFSERAIAKRRSLASIPAYYSDILRWLPIMKDPSKYFSTPCVNEIRGFCESTKIVLEEGLEARFARHQLFARCIRAALAAIGFSFFTEERFQAATLSVVNYPDGVDDKPFRNVYAQNGVVVAGGLGGTAGKVFRMGHMGNLSTSQLLFALQAVEKTLSSLGHKFEAGAAVRVAKGMLES